MLKNDLCTKLIQDNLVEESDIVKHSYTQQILDGNKKCVEKNDGNMITLTTRGDCYGVVVKTKVLGNYMPSGHDASKIVDIESVAPTVKENHGTITAVAIGGIRKQNESNLIGGIGEKDSNNNTQWKYQNRIYSSKNSMPSIATAFNPYVDDPLVEKLEELAEIGQEELRIRKLTPKECLRLMSLKDEDIELISEHQTNALLYHLAGDSICCNVLMAIFSQMLDINWINKFKEIENTYIKEE